MPKKTIAILTALLIWTTGAFAQSVSKYDPNVIPWKPKTTRFPDCGIEAKLDPRWPLERTVGTTSKGKTRVTYTAKLGVDYRKKTDKHPFSQVIINPGVLFTVSCFEASPKTVSDFRGYAKRFHARVKESDKKRNLGSNLGQIRRTKRTGAEHAFTSTGYTRTKEYAVDDTGTLLALHRGKSVRVSIVIDRKQGSPFVTDLPAGQVVSGTLNSGATVSARLSGPATKNVFKETYAYSRRKSDNEKIIATILKSVRAY